MSNFLSELRKQRLQLVESIAANEGDINLDIFEDFYPDQAHFVFELLQNAEDTGATEAAFTLTEDGCWFEHNGIRAFTEADVRAITGINNSRKKAEPDRIGQFGVGFKSVFIYTLSPTIYSANYSFRISDLIVPEAVPSDPVIDGMTRFWLPFDNPQNLSDTAFSEISAGLNELTETTLLFLTNIKSIKWDIKGEPSKEILCVSHTDTHVEVMKQVNSQTSASAHFLKFSQLVAGMEKQRVAIAFALDFLPHKEKFSNKNLLSDQLKIVPASRGQVAIFFPAIKETSGLRFHLHAPFVPALSRASIKETAVNNPLFDQIAALTASSLHSIRDLGLLSNDFLNVLPNPQDVLGERYVPIRTAIYEEMNSKPLTPTHVKGHAPARDLVQAKSALKDLLSHDDLQFLIDDKGDPPQWAVNRAPQGTYVEKFMNGLAITDWDTGKFVSCIVGKTTERHWRGVDAEFMKWLAGKSVEWHQQFYALLAKEPEAHSAIWRLKQCQIVRLADGKYSIGPKCHFPDDGSLKSTAVSWVDSFVYSVGKGRARQESARKFLEDLGVTSVGERQFVEAILEDGYASDSRKLNQREYVKHLRQFMKLLDDEPSSKSLLSSYHIFLGKDDKWHKPESVFLDAPYLETYLGEYIDIIGAKDKFVALSNAYASMSIDTPKVTRFAEKLGSMTRISIAEVTCLQNPEWSDLRRASGERITTSINRDYVIKNFKLVAERKSQNLAKLVWETMCSLPNTEHEEDSAYYRNPLRATYQKNMAGGPKFANSSLVHELRSFAWVPQDGSDFVKPEEARIELLPVGFTFDAGWPWIKAIQFGKNIEVQSAAATEKAAAIADHDKKQNDAAKALGFADAETARKVAEIPADELSQFLADREHRQKFQLPENEPKNPERRALKVSEQAAEAPGKVSEPRTRAVSLGTSAVKQAAEQYLRQQYTNPDGEMICQICSEPLPFRLSDGRHYVEKVEFFDDAEKRHFQNYLALCPNHAAMFQHALGSGDVIREMFLACNDGNLEIVLADKDAKIYFTGIHMADLKAIIE